MQDILDYIGKAVYVYRWSMHRQSVQGSHMVEIHEIYDYLQLQRAFWRYVTSYVNDCINGSRPAVALLLGFEHLIQRNIDFFFYLCSIWGVAWKIPIFEF